jgi:hypothetical protein
MVSATPDSRPCFCGSRIVEPVSACRNLRFRDTGIRGQRIRRPNHPPNPNPRCQRPSVRGACRLLGAFRPPPGNFRKRRTAWWTREDSNLQPDRYERDRFGPFTHPCSARLFILEGAPVARAVRGRRLMNSAPEWRAAGTLLPLFPFRTGVEAHLAMQMPCRFICSAWRTFWRASYCGFHWVSGAPEEIRTPDPQIRSMTGSKSAAHVPGYGAV